MPASGRLLCCFAITALLGCALPVSAQDAQPVTAAPRLASSGVYTEAQAAHGKTLFSDNCASCHGGDLEGSADMGGPPLAGPPFSHWKGLPVGALHMFIDTNMPPGNGGALGAVAEADIVAFILYKNEYPMGSTPLPADPAGLKAILMK